MKTEILFVIEDSPEGGFIARAFGHSIFTEGDSLEDIKKNIVEAVNCHFEAHTKPQLIRLHYVKDEVIAA